MDALIWETRNSGNKVSVSRIFRLKVGKKEERKKKKRRKNMVVKIRDKKEKRNKNTAFYAFRHTNSKISSPLLPPRLM